MSLSEDYVGDRANSEIPTGDETRLCVECNRNEAEKDSFYCRSCWDELDAQGYFDF